MNEKKNKELGEGVVVVFITGVIFSTLGAFCVWGIEAVGWAFLGFGFFSILFSFLGARILWVECHKKAAPPSPSEEKRGLPG